MKIIKLANYNLWANDRVRTLLEGLTEEEFSRERECAYESIRNLVTHIVIAMDFNFTLKMDEKAMEPNYFDDSLRQLSMSELLDHWREMDMWLRGFVSTHSNLKAVFPNFLGEGEMIVGHDDFFLQFILHTVHHRAQVMSALRLIRKEAVGTDYVFYLSRLIN